MQIIKRPVELAQQFISDAVKEGDITVDATAGNGNDTLFMARKVGRNGKVYSFDIQQQAIKETKEKLSNENILNRVELIQDSHENLDFYIEKKIKAAMLNLGYLPGGDCSIITKPNSTLNCLKKVTNLLQIGGIISIVIYTGHDGGEEEKEAVLNFLSSLNYKEFTVQQTKMINFKNNPPIFICVEKVR